MLWCVPRTLREMEQSNQKDSESWGDSVEAILYATITEGSNESMPYTIERDQKKRWIAEPGKPGSPL